MANFELTKVLLEIHKMLYRPVYNIFQTFRRSKQDPKSMHLRRSTSYSCVHSSECFSAFTGEWQIGQPHIYVMFVFLTYYFYYCCSYYYYFQNRFKNCLLTYYLLIAFSIVLPAKLAVSQLVKKFIPFYGTQLFITALISAHHLSLSSARSIQSMPSITILEDTP
jgi:hypothetical protein